MPETIKTYLQGVLAFMAVGVIAFALGTLTVAIHSLFR
jgi:hypothetical protein